MNIIGEGTSPVAKIIFNRGHPHMRSRFCTKKTIDPDMDSRSRSPNDEKADRLRPPEGPAPADPLDLARGSVPPGRETGTHGPRPDIEPAIDNRRMAQFPQLLPKPHHPPQALRLLPGLTSARKLWLDPI
jgi:hypothetical protein